MIFKSFAFFWIILNFFKLLKIFNFFKCEYRFSEQIILVNLFQKTKFFPLHFIHFNIEPINIYSVNNYLSSNELYI